MTTQIAINQFINGSWVELIVIPLEPNEDLKEAIQNVGRDLLNEEVYLLEGPESSVIIKRNDGPIRIDKYPYQQ